MLTLQTPAPIVWLCALQDYSIPQINLFAEANGVGRVTSYCDDTVEISSYRMPQTTASIKVHSGV